MKNVIKLFLTIFICLTSCGVGIIAANIYQANMIEYQPTDETWEVNNVNEALNQLYENLGVNELELIKEGSISSNITTSVVTDIINVEIGNYKQLLIIAEMGNYWYLTDSKSIKFIDLLVNDKNIFNFKNTVGVGGNNEQNGQVSYIVAIANCTPNSINEIKIQTQSVGVTFSINKNYKIYGIK